MNDHEQTAALLREVRLAMQLNDYPRALDALRQTVGLALQQGDNGAAGRHMGNLALLYYRLGRADDALKAFHDALHYTRLEQDALTESGLLGNIGNILREQSRHQEALRYLQEALKIAAQAGDVRGRGIWLSNLGLVYDDLNQPQRALELHTQAVVIARQLNDVRGLAARLGHLGNSHVSAGNISDAVSVFEEAVELLASLGQPREYALRLGVLGNLYTELGHSARIEADAVRAFERAVLCYDRARAIASELGDSLSEAELMRCAANALMACGRGADALQYYTDARGLYARLGLRARVDELTQVIRQYHA
jgi:tetratricopeptide (TPR) repeat protein